MGTIAKTKQPEVIELPRLDIRRITLTVVGDSALISHRWSEKARKQMLDTHMKKAKTAKAAKDPEEDYRESLYLLPPGARWGKHKGYGFPAVAFKAAAVDACSHVDGVTKVEARGAFHTEGEFVEIIGEPSIREDMVRVGMMKPDIRYRGEFKAWKAVLNIRYNANVLSAEQIINLFNTAGFAIGVGEWRPQRDGSFGMFHVATGEE